MVTDPRFDSEPTQSEAPPREKSGCSSCLTGCGIVGVIVVVLIVLGGVLLWIYRHDLIGSATNFVITQAVEATDLPDAEKQEMLVQAERLNEAIRDKKISAEQGALIMQQLLESPLLMTLGVSAIDKKYIESSGLPEEEKTEGRQTLNRFIRGVVDQEIPKRAVDDAMSHVAIREQPNGPWELRDQVSDEDLKKFFAAAKEAADRAEIPDQPETVDPSEELKQIIDKALDEPAP